MASKMPLYNDAHVKNKVERIDSLGLSKFYKIRVTTSLSQLYI